MKVPAQPEDMSPERAQQIYQQMLDRIGAAYFARDWAYFHHAIAVPHTFVTFDGQHEIADADGLRRIFDSVRQMIAERGITNYARICEAALFRSEDTIEGAHVTYLLRQGQTVSEPFPSKSILRVIDGYWRVCASDNAIGGTDLMPMALRAAGIAPLSAQSS